MTILTAGTALAAPPVERDAGTTGVELEFAAPRAPFLQSAEIVKIIEKSTTVYNIYAKGCSDVAVSDYAKAMWAEQTAEIETPVWVKAADGTTSIAPYKTAIEAVPFLKQGEAAFSEKQYTEAAISYRKALEASPHDYLALLYLGDSALHSGFLPDALEMYQRAEVANPADLKSYFFQATVFTEQGHLDQALNGYAEAFIRAPRRPTLRQALDTRSKRLGIATPSELFHPEALAQLSEDEVRVCLASLEPQWLAYGLCKAMWLVEKAHREAMTGRSDHHFSSIEEKECLGTLLEVYARQRQAGKTPTDVELERLNLIVSARMVDDFIFLELATRVLPQAALLVPEGMRRALKAYVRRFVFAPLMPSSDAGMR